MPVSDSIADLLTRIRNAQNARYDECECPWSRHKQQVCEVLQRAGFIDAVTVSGEKDFEKVLHITFSPENLHLTLRRISKPGRRVYRSISDMRPVMRGYGIAILSTSKGVITDIEARAKGIGGEVLCTIS